MIKVRQVCLWIIALHAISAIIHNQAHNKIEVSLSTSQNAFATIVIVVAPLLAAVFIWRNRQRLGAIILVVSMLASFIFGVVNHLMIDSPDQLAHISSNGWGRIFIVTAYALMITELAGVLAGTSLFRSSGTKKSAV